MSIFSMFSGHKDRLMYIYQQMQLKQAQDDARAQQAELIRAEQDQAATAKQQLDQQTKALEEQTSAAAAETKKRQLGLDVARLGGMTGYRSLLSGRKGGGGFGPRGLLDAG